MAAEGIQTASAGQFELSLLHKKANIYLVLCRWFNPNNSMLLFSTQHCVYTKGNLPEDGSGGKRQGISDSSS